MATLPTQQPSSSVDSQQQQQQQRHFSSQQQRHSSHRPLCQSGSSPDFEGPSPRNREQLRQSSSSETTAHGSAIDAELNPEWGLTKAGKKRQRLPLACQVCRKKKVRSSAVIWTS